MPETAEPTLVMLSPKDIRAVDTLCLRDADDDVADLAQMAASLEREGMIQPLVVRANGGGFELIAGGRRLQAARFLARRNGDYQVPALVVRADDRQAYRMALAENIQRKQLSPVEIAHQCKRLGEEGLNGKAIAEFLGVSQGYVHQKVKLLGLPDVTQRQLHDGQLSESAALELASVDEDERPFVSERAEQIAKADRTKPRGGGSGPSKAPVKAKHVRLAKAELGPQKPKFKENSEIQIKLLALIRGGGPAPALRLAVALLAWLAGKGVEKPLDLSWSALCVALGGKKPISGERSGRREKLPKDKRTAKRAKKQ